MERNKNYSLQDLKEGDCFFFNYRGIIEKWEVVEVLNEFLYVVDNDSFGNLFSFEEIENKGWLPVEKSIILLNSNHE